MSATLTIHGFETSNNMKVRAGLGYKGIDYEFVRIDPQQDREKIEAISGQFLTPVLVHGELVLFDSAAILRYLDASFRDTPKLYGHSLLEQWAIEDEEFWSRTVLAGPAMHVVHSRVAGHEVDARTRARCGDAMNAALDVLVSKLEGREWLVGDAMTAADISAAAVLHRFRLAEIFEFSSAMDALDPFIRRVLRFDRYFEAT